MGIRSPIILLINLVGPVPSTRLYTAIQFFRLNLQSGWQKRFLLQQLLYRSFLEAPLGLCEDPATNPTLSSLNLPEIKTPSESKVSAYPGGQYYRSCTAALVMSLQIVV
jgi:hypothetical protein